MNKIIILVVFVFGLAVGLLFSMNKAEAPNEMDKNDVENNVSPANDDGKIVDVDNDSIATEPLPINEGKGIIDLSNQKLSKVPDYVFNEVGTQFLILENNDLTGSLQAEIRQLKNLTVLDLSDNNFTGVPAEIGQLERLEILDLSNNPITGLPLELGNLKSLKTLDLSDTNYSEYDLGLIRKDLPSSVVIKL